MDRNPKELGHSVELEPFYSFLSGARFAALKNATKSYLAHGNMVRERRLRQLQEREESRRQHQIAENRRRVEAELDALLYPFGYLPMSPW